MSTNEKELGVEGVKNGMEEDEENNVLKVTGTCLWYVTNLTL